MMNSVLLFLAVLVICATIIVHKSLRFLEREELPRVKMDSRACPRCKLYGNGFSVIKHKNGIATCTECGFKFRNIN